MSFADLSCRGVVLNARFAVNGIQNAARGSFSSFITSLHQRVFIPYATVLPSFSIEKIVVSGKFYIGLICRRLAVINMVTKWELTSCKSQAEAQSWWSHWQRPSPGSADGAENPQIASRMRPICAIDNLPHLSSDNIP